MINRIKKFLHLSKQDTEDNIEATPSANEQINELFDDLKCDIIRFEFGSDFEAFFPTFCEHTRELRKNIMSDTGFILPVVHFMQNDDLQENECKIFIKEKLAYNDFIVPTTEETLKYYEIKIKELTETHLEDIFTNELTEKYIESAYTNNYRMITMLGYVLSNVCIKTILMELLRNKKSIKNIADIFEKIAEQTKIEEYPCHVKDPYIIAQRVCSCI